jgi:hypothetical protein
MQVKVEGAAAKIDAIFRFDKAIWKGIQKGVKDAAESVAADARGRVPSIAVHSFHSPGWGKWTATGSRGGVDSSGRNLGFDQGEIRKSIKPRFRSRYKSGFREVQGQAIVNSPAGAIYMLAGSQNKAKNKFNQEVNAQHGKNVWPRAMTPAYYAKGPQARKDIGDLIERAIQQVNQS